jgi:hypothetical protein
LVLDQEQSLPYDLRQTPKMALGSWRLLFLAVMEE